MAKVIKPEAMLKEQNLTFAQQGVNTNKETPALDFFGEYFHRDLKEDPNLSFMAIILGKEHLPKKDALDATGLSNRKFNQIFDEQYHPILRKMKTNVAANRALAKHLERKELLPHQRAICELLWKRMCHHSMGKVLERIAILTNRWLEDDYPQDKDFCEGSYDITVEELEEAMGLLLVHIIDLDEEKEV